ncbi:hypothetical protein HK102_013978 [Quaeritorhiza haematococci]|nr:hypothetical protein HK102_013978 [Quaeritorhiza haematococci]
MVRLAKTAIVASAALALCSGARALANPEQSIEAPKFIQEPVTKLPPPQPPTESPIAQPIAEEQPTAPRPAPENEQPVVEEQPTAPRPAPETEQPAVVDEQPIAPRPKIPIKIPIGGGDVPVRPALKIVVDAEKRREGGTGRNLEESIDVGRKQLVINSRLSVGAGNGTTNGTVSNRFQYAFGVRGMPHIRASYFEKNEDDNSKVRSTWLLGVAGIAEVTPTINITETDSFIPFIGQASKWTNMQIINEPIDNTTSFKIAMITYNDGGFSCTVNATFSPLEATGVSEGAQNVTFRPNAVKYSMELDNFPYKYNDSELVIVKLFYSSSTVKLSSGARNRTISFSDNSGFYNWVSNATTETGAFVSIEPFGDSLLPEDLPIGSGSIRRRLPDLPKELKDELLELRSSARTEEKGAFALFKTNFAAANVTRPRTLFWDPEIGVSTTVSAQGGDGDKKGSAGVANHMSAIVSLMVASVVALFVW